MAEFTLKSTQFRRERAESWRELEQLLDKADRGGIRSLSAAELNRLPALYRSTVSSLSVARAISLDRALLDYLTNLTCRAYVVVYSSKRPPSEAIAEFLTRRLPQTVRRYWIYLAVSLGCMLAGVLAGYLLTIHDVERFYSFVSEQVAQGRNPASSDEALRDVLYSGDDSGVSQLQQFATFLFTHNAKVGILCFALGFAAGAPVVILLFYNGLTLGAFAALYASRGMGLEFWAWVLPHGVTELLAVVLCGAAGLVFGMAVVFPGPHTRLQNLAIKGRQVALVVIGAALMLLIAAVIEGLFRQMVQDFATRWWVATVTAVGWALYYGLAGRRARNEALA
jgi:uncharacterized membrane protein SpoIIM required for sporulation